MKISNEISFVRLRENCEVLKQISSNSTHIEMGQKDKCAVS
jgi:hypothetical protein